MRLRSTSTTVKRHSPIDTVSPPFGTDPSRSSMKPATVSNSPSGTGIAWASRSSAAGTVPSTTSDPSRIRSTGRSSQSYSSWISPTISSMRSSRVTRPLTEPCSSTTRARWVRRFWSSFSSSPTFFVSGTRWTGCRILRKTTGWRFSSRRRASFA